MKFPRIIITSLIPIIGLCSCSSVESQNNSDNKESKFVIQGSEKASCHSIKGGFFLTNLNYKYTFEKIDNTNSCLFTEDLNVTDIAVVPDGIDVSKDLKDVRIEILSASFCDENGTILFKMDDAKKDIGMDKYEIYQNEDFTIKHGNPITQRKGKFLDTAPFLDKVSSVKDIECIAKIFPHRLKEYSE